MTTFNNVLCLLAIFIAYGITGRLDYADAVQMEQIRQERRHAGCLTASSPVVRKPLAQINDLSFDPRSRRANGELPEGSRSCAPRVL